MAKRGQKKKRAQVGDPADALGFACLRELWLSWQRERAYSERTVTARRAKLDRFVLWCQERGLVRPAQITIGIMERYQRSLYAARKADGKRLGVSAQRDLLQATRSFFKWLCRRNLLPANPAADLELPRVPKTLPAAPLSVGEAERILAAPDVSCPFGLRDRAMLETLYATGMRRMELANLRLGEADLAREVAYIRRGKGGKDRVVPLGERATYWIGRYVEKSRPSLACRSGQELLFLATDGEGLSLTSVSKVARRYLLEAGIGKGGGCHLFRHAAATHMLDNGADTRFIQELLGHAKLETTQIYTHVSIEQLRRIHAATHPGASLGGKPTDKA